ncbi:nucleotidyltransferase family protein [Paenibacillus paridis]|uniref:nucleotidyltransferase family protein n=1 Tax=Paenibacillus paridis TaxID=2583376 RepID=UPI00111CCE77|nr:nucleotidyltransferase family protein [Paenibacillus paridis]
MNLRTENDILALVQEDEWMMDILRTVSTLHLPDWWVCAGFIRSKIWDVLHGFRERTATPDVDVIYFDDSNIEEDVEKRLEARLRVLQPHIPWSVKNEARMHLIDQAPPYLSCTDAMSKFPETATALGLTLDDDDQVRLAAPCGIADAIQMKVRPTPFFAGSAERLSYYEQRIARKNWKQRWPLIQVFDQA